MSHDHVRTRCQRQRSPARRAVLVRPPSAARLRSFTLLLPLAEGRSARTTHQEGVAHTRKRCSACVSDKQCRCTAHRSVERSRSQANERHQWPRRRPPIVQRWQCAGADASCKLSRKKGARKRKGSLCLQRAALQLCLQQKRAVEALYSALQHARPVPRLL